jgi:hypothetical protein
MRLNKDGSRRAAISEQPLSQRARLQKVADFERNFFNNPLYKMTGYWRIAEWR